MKNISLFFVFLVFVEGVYGDEVSEKEGKSITLRTGLSVIQKDDVMDWRFGDDKILIARVEQQNIPTTKDDVLDGQFKDRLKLDGLTGDLTITNIKTTDSGVYEVTNSTNAFRKSISVTVVPDSGLSSGTIAGIVVGVIAAVAAAVGGVAYGYWKKGQIL